MHHIKTGHFFALILAVLMLIPAISSCGNSPQSLQGDTEGTVVTNAESETNAGPQSELPTDLNFDGEVINIWYFTKNSDASESFVDMKGDIEGDVVDAAIYERNLKVEEQLNLKMNFIDPGIASSEVGNAVRKIVMSASTDYDLFNVVQWNSSSLVLENVFMNMIEGPYLDLEKPWWAYNYMKEIAIGNSSIYFLCGDVTLDMIRCIACMYYNKAIYDNVYGAPDSMYEIVLDQKWTLEKMRELVTGGYADVNGNGKVDQLEDQMGFVTNNYNNLDAFIYGSKVRVTDRDQDGIPYLVFSQEHTYNFFSKFYDLCYNTIGGAVGKDNLENIKQFNNGYMLFLPGWFYTSEKLRDMKQDYGIIPFPKYDEAQDGYLSVVHDIATLMCLPVTCTKVEAVCAMLEAMAYTSYKQVTPVYYEVAMKTKYTRDAISSQIIDILHDNNMTDIAYVYGGSFNQLGYIVREVIQNKKTDVASLYTTKEKSAIANMNKLIDQYTKLGEQ